MLRVHADRFCGRYGEEWSIKEGYIFLQEMSTLRRHLCQVVSPLQLKFRILPDQVLGNTYRIVPIWVWVMECFNIPTIFWHVRHRRPPFY